MDRTNDEILQDAQAALDLTTRGLDEYLAASGRQRASGIRNVVVWGRVTTATFKKLQAASGHTVREWWQPYSEEMKSDPEFRYLYDLRNDVEKAGTVGRLGTTTHIDYLGPDEQRRLTANPPPNAKGFFIGDRWGGSGWQIELPSGETENFYVQLPADIAVTVSMHFMEPTTSQRFAPPERPIEEVLQRYVAFLESLMGSAIQAFGSRSA